LRFDRAFLICLLWSRLLICHQALNRPVRGPWHAGRFLFFPLFFGKAAPRTSPSTNVLFTHLSHGSTTCLFPGNNLLSIPLTQGLPLHRPGSFPFNEDQTGGTVVDVLAWWAGRGAAVFAVCPVTLVGGQQDVFTCPILDSSPIPIAHRNHQKIWPAVSFQARGFADAPKPDFLLPLSWLAVADTCIIRPVCTTLSKIHNVGTFFVDLFSPSSLSPRATCLFHFPLCTGRDSNIQ